MSIAAPTTQGEDGLLVPDHQNAAGSSLEISPEKPQRQCYHHPSLVNEEEHLGAGCCDL